MWSTSENHYNLNLNHHYPLRPYNLRNPNYHDDATIKHVEIPEAIASRDQLNQEFRRTVGDLDEGGASDVMYTTMYDDTTGETFYINGNSNAISKEQYDAQEAAVAALTIIPEITAEEILQVESDKNRMDVFNNNINAFQPINLINNNGMGVFNGGNNNSNAPQPTNNDPNPEDNASEGEDNKEGDESEQKANKKPVSSKKRSAPQGGAHRKKRWSETKG
jgi:hypothetical protein